MHKLRTAVSRLLFLSSLLVVLPDTRSLPAEERPPNIVLILADDVGREVLGCYGGESYPTPQLDALASRGMRFSHCYSMPVCHPTRVCLLTGKYPVNLNRPKWGTFPKKKEAETFPNLLRKAGYATAVAGKWQLTLMKKDRFQPQRMGFDEWSVFGWHEGARYHDPMIYENGKLRTDTEGKYGPDLYVDFLSRFIRKNRQRPFFAFYSMALCHDVTDDLKEPVPYGPEGRWMNYQEMAQDMDRQVGRLLNTLDELQLREKTLVLFTTDNGTAAASYLRYENGKFERPAVYSTIEGRRVQGGKGQLTDWGTRVPLIASWPGRISESSTSEALVDFSDFFPTLIQVANAALSSELRLDGHSFLPALSGEPTARSWAYAEGRRGLQFVRTQRFKLYSSGKFFDLVAEPDEERVLSVAEQDEQARQVRRNLERALEDLSADR